MIITINGKEYKKEGLKFIDSINCFSWQKFFCFKEVLHKTEDGYIHKYPKNRSVLIDIHIVKMV